MAENERKPYWSQAVDDVVAAFDVDPDRGLDRDEVERRRDEHGPNLLHEVEHESVLAILVRQFSSLIMLVLFLAAALSAAFGHWIDAAAIAVAIVINAGIGFLTELRALRSMEALQELDQRFATVRREGENADVEAEDLVPGDVVEIEAGDVVTADLRLVEANDLQIDESALTGESVPVAKTTDPVDDDTPLSERVSMLYKGTAVAGGSGRGIAVGTGMDTELGGVTSLVQEAESEEDPLSQRLDALASRLVQGILGVVVIAGAAGMLAGKELRFMLETAVALFVAAVPEGLPIVATLALARGMHRMARRNALVRRLSAVQTLGSTNVILTDKTGTLTENLMTATELRLVDRTVSVSGTGLETEGDFRVDDDAIDPGEDEVVETALGIGVLCTNASLSADGDATGDPTEVALLVAGAKAGMRRDDLLERYEEVREYPFDPSLKMMATVHRGDEGLFTAVKGAPDAVLERCARVMTSDGERDLDDDDRGWWNDENRRLASEGRRVLALAHGTVDDADDDDPYRDLTLVGLVGLLDPVRDEVRQPLEIFRAAGIRMVMVTGDQEDTAVAVARDLDLLDGDGRAVAGSDVKGPDDADDETRERLLEATVFYRASPEQKLDLIALHQDRGSIVGMTGDGVNDAPALKKADIGIAMGQRGEQVAADAADIILQDDELGSITMAIEQGRVIYGNVRSFVVYMISGNVGEILMVFVAALVGAPLPLLPLQILYINAVNDIFPALALGVGPGSGREMERPPRDPDEPVLTRSHWISLLVYGAVIGVPLLGGFALCLTVLGMSNAQATTVSFLGVAFARLWHVFNMRENDSSPWRNQVTTNRWIWGALALCIGLLLLAAHLPVLADVLEVVPPDATMWTVILGVSLVPLLIGQGLKALRWV